MADQDPEKDVTAAGEQPNAAQESMSPEAETAQQPEPDELVPKKAFLARVGEESEKRRKAEEERQAAIERAARAEGELAALRQQRGNGNGQAPVIYTREQLKAAVQANNISQDEARDIWESQEDLRVQRKISEALTQTTVVQRVQGKRHAYSRLVPGWNTPGTEANRKAEAAFMDLLADGLPRTAATEVLALERAFGSLEALERSSRSEDITSQERATSPEGGSTSGVKPHVTTKGDPLKYLTAEERGSYELLVRQGRMTWDEVRDQVKWSLEQDVNPPLKAKMLSRVK